MHANTCDCTAVQTRVHARVCMAWEGVMVVMVMDVVQDGVM